MRRRLCAAAGASFFAGIYVLTGETIWLCLGSTAFAFLVLWRAERFDG